VLDISHAIRVATTGTAFSDGHSLFSSSIFILAAFFAQTASIIAWYCQWAELVIWNDITARYGRIRWSRGLVPSRPDPRGIDPVAPSRIGADRWRNWYRCIPIRHSNWLLDISHDSRLHRCSVPVVWDSGAHKGPGVIGNVAATASVFAFCCDSAGRDFLVLSCDCNRGRSGRCSCKGAWCNGGDCVACC
jgi:hypothetical protein